MPRADGEAPEAAVAQRAQQRRRLELVLVEDLGATADDRGAHDGADHAQHGEEEEAGRRVAVRDQRRQGEGGDESPERNRGLPNAEREPALVGSEPVHDGAAARRVHARACGAGEREEHDQRSEVRRVGGSDEKRCARAETEREDDPLAEAVGGDPPREHGHERAHPLRPQHDADLPELRSYSSRSVGTSTGSPIARAENDVCESVPAARTAQR